MYDRDRRGIAQFYWFVICLWRCRNGVECGRGLVPFGLLVSYCQVMLPEFESSPDLGTYFIDLDLIRAIYLI
jgi:hypothetical protein